MNTKEMFFIRNLASAVLLQAAKDYCNGSVNDRRAIIKDLNSKWMDELTEGRSKVIAEKLLKNSDEIAARLARTNRSISVNPRRTYRVNKTKNIQLFS